MTDVSCESARAFADLTLAVRRCFNDEEVFYFEQAEKLSVVQLRMLLRVASLGKATMGDVAKSQNTLSLSSVTLIIDKLVRAGYIDRARCEKDRRVVHVSLSEKGRVLHDNYVEMLKRVSKKILSKLSQAEQAAFLDLYRKLLVAD